MPPISLNSSDIQPAAEGLWAIEKALADTTTDDAGKVAAATAAAQALHAYVGNLLSAKGGTVVTANDPASKLYAAVHSGTPFVYMANPDSVPGGGGKGGTGSSVTAVETGSNTLAND